jgi:hypothetical protein
MSEKANEHDYVPLLRAWLSSVRGKFKLNEQWIAAIDHLDRRLIEQPSTVNALDVGRLFQPLEKNRMVTTATPGADRALHFLVDAGRVGLMDRASDELRDWFRKHYVWATGSMVMQVDELNTYTSDEVIRNYFNAA